MSNVKTDQLKELQALMEKLWARTGLGDCVQISTVRRDDGSEHVEIVDTNYDIVVTEKGSEVQRTAGLSISDAARRLLHVSAVAHACAAEVRDRRAPKDAPLLPGVLEDTGYSRWNWMAETVDIMSRISPEFGDWTLQEYRTVLSRYPLTDHEIRNARYPLPPEFV